MENAILIGIGLGIIWQGYVIIKNQCKLRKDIDDSREWDRNIDFSGYNGEVDMKCKHYDNLKQTNDRGQEVGEIKIKNKK